MKNSKLKLSLMTLLMWGCLAGPAFAQDPFLKTLDEIKPAIDNLLSQSQKTAIINSFIAQIRPLSEKGFRSRSGAEESELHKFTEAVIKLDPSNSNLKALLFKELLDPSSSARDFACAALDKTGSDVSELAERLITSAIAGNITEKCVTLLKKLAGTQSPSAGGSITILDGARQR